MCLFRCAVSDAVQQGDRARARGGAVGRGGVRREHRGWRGRRRAASGRRGLPVRRGLPTGHGFGRWRRRWLFRRPGTGRGGGGRVQPGGVGPLGIRRSVGRRSGLQPDVHHAVLRICFRVPGVGGRDGFQPGESYVRTLLHVQGVPTGFTQVSRDQQIDFFEPF